MRFALIRRAAASGSAELLIRCVQEERSALGWLRPSVVAQQYRPNMVRAAGRGLSRCGEGCMPGCGGAGGAGETDVDVDAAVRAGVEGEGGVMGFGDGRGERPGAASCSAATSARNSCGAASSGTSGTSHHDQRSFRKIQPTRRAT